jgi:transposase-like protein
VRKYDTGGAFDMAGKEGMKAYPREEKLEAVALFHEEGKTRAEIAELLGIDDEARVKKWKHQYRQVGDAAFLRERREGLIGRSPKKENKAATIFQIKLNSGY